LQAINSLPDSASWAAQQLSTTDEGFQFAEAIKNHHAIVVSDGSCSSGKAAAAIIAKAQIHSPISITCCNKVSGPPASVNAYRAELSGLFGGLVLIQAICLLHQVQAGKVKIALDGESALKRADVDGPTPYQIPSSDLIHAIRMKRNEILNKHHASIEYEWAEGHQLEKHGCESPLGSLNRIADSLAKEHCHSSFPSWNLNLPFHGEGWAISIGGIKQDSFVMNNVYDLVYGKVSRQYWIDRHNVPPAAMEHVDWNALAAAFPKWDFGKRVWMTKHLSGTSPTGRVMRRREKWDHDKCPRCDNPDEHTWHVLECKDPPTQKLMEARFERLNTHPHITAAFSNHLRGWYYNRQVPFLSYDPPVQQAIYQQDSISWRMFFFGRVAKGWTDAQQLWLDRVSTRWKRSASSWATKLIFLGMEIFWDSWEHRNSVLHHEDHHWNLELRHERLSDMLKLHRELNTRYAPSHLRWLLKHNSDSLKAMSDEQQQQWLTSAKLVHLWDPQGPPLRQSSLLQWFSPS
jgi:hypothetical protein